MYLSLSGVGQGFFCGWYGGCVAVYGARVHCTLGNRFAISRSPLALIEILQKNFKTEIIFIAFCEFVLYTDINT